MKITSIRSALVALLVLGASAARAETVVVVGDPWCPYNCEAGSDRPGFAIEIAREVFAAAGVDLRYENHSWDDAIALTRKGEHTAIVGASKEDAPDFVFPARAVGTSVDVFIIRGGDAWKYRGPDSLAQRRVGVIRDYSYGKTLDEWFEGHPAAAVVEGEDAKEQLMRKLLAREIDVFLEDRAVALEYARRRDVLGLVSVAGTADDPTPVYIAFSPASKRSPAYARQLADGIAALEKSGRLQAIYAKYGYAQ